MKKDNILRIGTIVLLLITLGKIVSFLRDIIFSFFFGASYISDAYFASNIIPNLINLPIITALLTFFIPIYNNILIKNGRKSANEFSSNIISVYVLISFVLTVIVFIFSSQLVKLTSPGFDEETVILTIKLLRISCFSFPLTMATWVFINISNANKKHIIPQLLVIINSTITILALIIFTDKYGIIIVPLIGIFGWIIQFIIQKLFIKNYFSYRFKFNLTDKNLKRMLYLSVPVFLAIGANQINLTIDNLLSSNLAEGSISYLNYSHKIVNLINGTITTAIITIMYPIFSVYKINEEYDNLSERIKSSIYTIILILIPITFYFIIFSKEIVSIIFQRGEFLLSDTLIVANVLVGYAIGFVFLATKELLSRCFYVYENSLIPTIINVIAVILNIILNFVFITKFGLFGLALATSISYIFTFFTQLIIFQKKFLKIFKIEDILKIGKILFVNFILYFIMSNVIKQNIDLNFIKLIFYSILIYLLYIVVLYAIDIDEIRSFVNKILTKIIKLWRKKNV